MTTYVVLDSAAGALGDALAVRSSLVDRRSRRGADRILFVAGDPATILDVALPRSLARQLRVATGHRRMAVLLSFVADVRAMYSDAAAR